MKNIDLKKVTFNELQKTFSKALEDIMTEFGSRIIDDVMVYDTMTESFINDFEVKCLNNMHYEGLQVGQVYTVFDKGLKHPIDREPYVMIGKESSRSHGWLIREDTKHQFEVVEDNKNPLNGGNRKSVETNSNIVFSISQSEEVLKMQEMEYEAILHIYNTSELFSRLYSKHGDYFLQEYEPHQWVMPELFASMSDQGLKEALNLPNNIFKKLIQKELDEREKNVLIMNEKPSRTKEFNVVNPGTEEAEDSALSNPAFREILSFNPMFEEIKEESGIDLLDYDSLNDFFYAYYSTLETKVLVDYLSTSDGEENETIKAVLASRESMGSSVLQYELGEPDE